MEKTDKAYAHAFTSVPWLGPQKLRRLRNHFGSFKQAWSCRQASEFSRAGLEEKIIGSIQRTRAERQPEEDFARLAKAGIKCWADDEMVYPKLLKEIYAPPVLLYSRGQWAGGDELTLAVVGTRKFTSYGALAVQQIVGALADRGITIVSGLALGIDALAHQATLENGGRTLAILGSGLADTNIFPRTNYRLAQRIMERGALLSEYPPACPPRKQNFPVRNRLISGLCRGTLVIEAGEKSGALITAWQALEQDREVFAVPGAINAEKSAGTNMLISRGAHLVRTAQDIFDELNIEQPQQLQAARKDLPGSRQECVIYQSLSGQPAPLDQLVDLTGFDVTVISSTLSIMELKGLVKNIGGNRYIKC